MPKNAMQSGTYQTHKWKLEFDNQQRWENPLMGWGSTGDPISNLNLEFNSKEDAIVYCQRMGNFLTLLKLFFNKRFLFESDFFYNLFQGIEYSVTEPVRIKKNFGKSYGANFSWDKRTRRSTK